MLFSIDSDEIDKNRFNGDDDFEFKDKEPDYTYNDKSETPKTERATPSKRRTPAGKQQIDLRAAASQLQSSDSQVCLGVSK